MTSQNDLEMCLNAICNLWPANVYICLTPGWWTQEIYRNTPSIYLPAAALEHSPRLAYTSSGRTSVSMYPSTPSRSFHPSWRHHHWTSAADVVQAGSSCAHLGHLTLCAVNLVAFSMVIANFHLCSLLYNCSFCFVCLTNLSVCSTNLSLLK